MIILTKNIEKWKHVICRRILSRNMDHLRSNKISVVFTFDTEEDWDNNNPLYPNSMVYYDSYKYLDAGIFYQLVKGLDERCISATFYVTYNIARDAPLVLGYLKDCNQNIGAHVHPHNFQWVDYPYSTGKRGDGIASYDYTQSLEWMRLIKNLIESLTREEVSLYRSGQLSCDCKTEYAAKLAGFKAISNHKKVYYGRIPGIWNLGVGEEDLFDLRRFANLTNYIEYFNERIRNEKIIVFSAHPMLLYDHNNDTSREDCLKNFFRFVDYIKGLENIEIISQYQLLTIVEGMRQGETK